MPPVEFERQILDNGLTVLYAPLHSAPVVQVRVLYHVGSRDEEPTRQGFAHMFEHMMFRGSAHIAPELHMKLIGVNGGDANAFTSFDQTTYHETLPSNNLPMALYLEADRMASFKVNDNIFQTERKVVAEEWRMRYGNQPTGALYQDFTGVAFKTHSYHWTPIGNMDQLRTASSGELQSFFNTYYVPNNACLIIAGDIQILEAKQWVEKYFGWIPRGPEITRVAQPEPEQTETRKLVVYKPNVPLTNLCLGFKTTDYRSDDHYALGVLADILSGGRSARLDSALVNSPDAPCIQIGASDEQLEDKSLFIIQTVIAQGRDADAVQQQILDKIYAVAQGGVTPAEVDKVLVQAKQALIAHRETAEQIATALGEEQVFGGDANRINETLKKLESLTPAELQTVAQKYFVPQHLTVVQYRPDPLGINARKAAATQAAQITAEASATQNASVKPSTEMVLPRVTEFPTDYPNQPPVNHEMIKVTLNKGQESSEHDLKVITLTDQRLPLCDVTLIMPGGGDGEPSDKVGLAGMTAQMLRRGSAGQLFLDLSGDLESKAISIEASDNGDNTRLNISCGSDQLDEAITRAHQILTQPNFSPEEFQLLQQQSVGGLVQGLSSPATVAQQEITQTFFGDTPMGRVSTPAGLLKLSIDDVKDWYKKFYQLDGALVVISGDITPERGKQIAAKLVGDFANRQPHQPIDYALKPSPTTRRTIVIDNPEGRQATIRMAAHAFDIHSDEKYAGTIAGQVLSAGIDSRLNKYVRAEKGLTYGCTAFFRPTRHAGLFSGSVDTDPDTAVDAIVAMFRVFADMKSADVTPQELADAKTRVAGSFVMEMQTIDQQASRRIDQILNGYPIDYYDNYSQHVAEQSADAVRAVMDKYVKADDMLFVIVAPAATVQPQLEKLGSVEVTPMPLRRPGMMPEKSIISPSSTPATRP